MINNDIKGGRGICKYCNEWHNNVSYHEVWECSKNGVPKIQDEYAIGLLTNKTRWKCKRCNTMVDMVNFKCNCETSPSPWEPIFENHTQEVQSLCPQCNSEFEQYGTKWQRCNRRLCPTRLMGNSKLGNQSNYPEYPNQDKVENIKYTVGFVFDKDLKRVLLITKNKSPKGLEGKMIGLLNGLGGKLEVGETIHQGISREVKEECDLNIPPEKWINYCNLNAKFGYVYCFYAIVDSFTHSFKNIYKSNESEVVGDYWLYSEETMDTCHENYTILPHMPNIDWLIPMALNHYKKLDNAVFEKNEK